MTTCGDYLRAPTSSAHLSLKSVLLLKNELDFPKKKIIKRSILGDERSLLLLARAIDPKQTNMMTETVKILSAFCIIGEENM